MVLTIDLTFLALILTKFMARKYTPGFRKAPGDCPPFSAQLEGERRMKKIQKL